MKEGRSEPSFLCYQNFFASALLEIRSLHAEGWKSISRGKSSNLPASISNMKTNFEKTEKFEKLPVGPTSARPGPMLLMVVSTAVKFVTRSLPSNATIKTDEAKIITNVTI